MLTTSGISKRPSISPTTARQRRTDREIIPLDRAGTRPVRTSTVISVGIATLAALIGAGGLGELIFRGLRTINYKLMLAGAVPAAMLALILDLLLAWIESLLTPKGLKLKTRQ